MYLPRRFRSAPDAPAIIPTTSDEVSGFAKLINPMMQPCGPWNRPGATVTSPMLGITASTATLVGQREAIGNTPLPQETKKTTIAQTLATIYTSRDRRGVYYYKTNHPVIVTEAPILSTLDPYNTAAIVGHELVHAYDVIHNPVLKSSRIGCAASELVGYFVSSVCHRITDQPFQGKAFAYSIEEWRQQNTNLGTPFTPQETKLPYFEALFS